MSPLSAATGLPDLSQLSWVKLQELREAARQRLLTHWVNADAFNIPRAIGLARLINEFLPFPVPAGFHILELGAGRFNPHAMGFLLYLNGYPRVTATDLARLHAPQLAARWLYEAALHAIAFPAQWVLPATATDPEQIRQRAYTLPLAALAEGDYASLQAMPGQPFRYLSLLEERAEHALESYDYIYSNAVLEHIMDVPAELAWQYAVLRPSGQCAALIGLDDHRIFDQPELYAPWSFMLDGIYGPDQPIRPDLRINGLRSSQLRQLVTAAGFIVEQWEENAFHPAPSDLAERVRPEFKLLPPSDLTTFRVKAMLRKPAA